MRPTLRPRRGGDRARLRLPQRRAAPCRDGARLARAHRAVASPISNAAPTCPITRPACEALIRAGSKPDAAYNNCSGKHTGFLTTAVHLGEPTRGYIRYDHPVQQRILGVLEQMCGLDLGDAPRGIDGCGIPVIGIPLGNMALAMARLADPVELPPRRAAAAQRILAAMAAEPFLVAGTGRVLQQGDGSSPAPRGAEDRCRGRLHRGPADTGPRRRAQGRGRRQARGRGGAWADAARSRRAHRAEEKALADALTPPILNRVGRETGRIRPAADAAF